MRFTKDSPGHTTPPRCRSCTTTTFCLVPWIRGLKPGHVRNPSCFTMSSVQTPSSHYLRYWAQITFMDKWRYNQIQRFLLTFPQPLQGVPDLTGIELLFYHKDHLLHCVLQFYKALIELQCPSYPKFLAKWETDLESSITDKQRDKILQLAHVSSLASRMVETNYKLLMLEQLWKHCYSRSYLVVLSSNPPLLG